MKNKPDHKPADDQKKIRESKSFFQHQAEKVKSGNFTCPFCYKVFQGFAAMSTHLKDHCT